MEVLKEEADRMNAENIIKLPKSPRSGKIFVSRIQTSVARLLFSSLF